MAALGTQQQHIAPAFQLLSVQNEEEEEKRNGELLLDIIMIAVHLSLSIYYYIVI